MSLYRMMIAKWKYYLSLILKDKGVLFLTFFIICACFFASSSAYAWQDRLDKKGIDRLFKHYPQIIRTSKKYETPLDVILGIIYNESNGRNVIGDAGYAYSLGQIRCSYDSHRFSWLPFLKEKEIGINKCQDLMVPHKNIEAISVILKHHYQREKVWSRAIMAYHLGIFWKRQQSRAHHYLKRVKYFGKHLKEAIESSPEVKITKVLSRFEKWLKKKIITALNWLSEAKKDIKCRFTDGIQINISGF